MKIVLQRIAFALIVLAPLFSLANPYDSLIIIKGSVANKGYTQIEVASYTGYAADTSQLEIMTAAWTCNAIGYPTCNYRAIFKYDLSAIPANSIVDSAKLLLYAQTNSGLGNPGNPTFGTNNASLLQKVTQPWSKQATGWLNQPATSVADQKTLPQSTSYQQNYVVDITDFAASWVSNPESNYGMLMKLQNENYYNSMIFNSGLASSELQPTLMLYVTIIPTDDTCINLKGDTSAASGFKQLELASYGGYDADTSQTDLMTAAWTCNALGYPTCNYRALFKYDLSSITSDANVVSAKLYLTAQTNSPLGNPGNPMFGTANSSLLQKVTTPWAVASTGWLNQPSTTTDAQKVLAQSASTIQDYTVDITDFVQDWVANPENNYGMLMKLQNETYYNSLIFNSGKAADNLKPVLQICIRKNVLPVILKGFSGNLINNKSVNLSWAILDGSSLSSILVERSYNGNAFTRISTVTAKSATTETKYTSVDNELSTTTGKVYYRLKLVNKDGSFKYSNVLVFQITNIAQKVQLMPNPVKDNFQLLFKSNTSTAIKISITDSYGKIVYVSTYQVVEGSNAVTIIPSKHLAQGLYIVQFVLDGQMVTKKFMKQ